MQAIVCLQDITDELVVGTLARENLMFAVNGLSMDDRIAASHSLSDLIKKCVFAGKQCDMEK